MLVLMVFRSHRAFCRYATADEEAKEEGGKENEGDHTPPGHDVKDGRYALAHSLQNIHIIDKFRSKLNSCLLLNLSII